MKFSSIAYLSSAALLASSSSAFTVTPGAPRASALASTITEADQFYFVDDAPADADVPSSLLVSEQRVERPKPVKKAPKKPSGGHTEGGLFAPSVLLAKKIMGEERLNKVRGKAIGMHSEVIRDFVDTYETDFGQYALETLFGLADEDKNGRIDEMEFRQALMRLGFKHLNDKQINGIFARADKDGDGTLDLEEFKAEAPKTLKTNLIKLAKSNGGELGFLA
jgi:hypothetical protein